MFHSASKWSNFSFLLSCFSTFPPASFTNLKQSSLGFLLLSILLATTSIPNSNLRNYYIVRRCFSKFFFLLYLYKLTSHISKQFQFLFFLLEFPQFKVFLNQERLPIFLLLGFFLPANSTPLLPSMFVSLIPPIFCSYPIFTNLSSFHTTLCYSLIPLLS